jgi:Holliday junction resolvase RusA-like endonuclease
MNSSFRINCLPVAQKRARSRATPKNGKWIATTYKDPAQQQQEDNFIPLLQEHKPLAPHAGPVSLNVIVYLPIPASKSKKWQAAALSREILPTKKPDLDNLLKHLKDCMKGIFYLDDKQIIAVQAFKYYAMQPGWDIEVGYL